MFIRELSTADPSVKLVKPNAARDAALSVEWLADPTDRETLALMGVTDRSNQPSTLKQEQARIAGFLTGNDTYNWMIKVDASIVGAIWADLKPTTNINAPAISVMIGDLAVRGRGIGRLALAAVVSFLESEGHAIVYARHLVANHASAALLKRLGFQPAGPAYHDADGLTWQNLAHSRIHPSS